MKAILTLIFVMSTSSFSQGLIFSGIDELPKTLNLTQHTLYDGRVVFEHRQFEPYLASVRINFDSDRMKQLSNFFKQHGSTSFLCDGEYSFSYDQRGMQQISLKSIKVCIDNDGWIAAVGEGVDDAYARNLNLNRELNKRKQMNSDSEDVEINDDSNTKKSDGSAGSTFTEFTKTILE